MSTYYSSSDDDDDGYSCVWWWMYFSLRYIPDNISLYRSPSEVYNEIFARYQSSIKCPACTHCKWCNGRDLIEDGLGTKVRSLIVFQHYANMYITRVAPYEPHHGLSIVAVIEIRTTIVDEIHSVLREQSRPDWETFIWDEDTFTKRWGTLHRRVVLITDVGKEYDVNCDPYLHHDRTEMQAMLRYIEDAPETTVSYDERIERIRVMVWIRYSVFGRERIESILSSLRAPIRNRLILRYLRYREG